MDYMPSTQEKIIYVFLFGEYKPRDQQLGVYCCVSYVLKVLFVEAHGQFFSFPED